MGSEIYEYLMGLLRIQCPHIVERNLKYFVHDLTEEEIEKIKKRIAERLQELGGDCDK